MSISEAIQFFDGFEAIQSTLRWLNNVGLGYLTLGQNGMTLSGGEAQRLKLAKELDERSFTHRGNITSHRNHVYILDEPTTGLHFSDVQQLLKVLHQLVEQGNSVIAIEHHLDVVASADWLIDLGPGGGDAGGEVVGEGTPETIAELNTPTGRVLKKWFQRRG